MSDQVSEASDSDDLVGLELELAAACAELEEYQRLIDELPEIYEAKFGSQLHALAQEIRHLTDERLRLQLQIQNCIQAETVLSTSASSSASSRGESLSSSGSGLRRSAFRPLTLAVATGSLALIMASALAWQAHKARLAPGFSAHSSPKQSTSPRASAVPHRPAAPQPAQPQLRLRAQGEVWLELRSADNSLLFVSTLQPGQTLSFPLGDGLRIRSGRPHLLQVARANQPFAPLGVANDFSWHTLTPMDSGQIPSPKPEVINKPS